MYQIMERRLLWFTISLVAIVPGLLFVIYMLATTGAPLPLSIDYTGGAQWEVRFEKTVAATDVRKLFVDAGYPDTSAFLVGDDGQTVQLKLTTLDTGQKEQLKTAITEAFGPYDELTYRSIGPAIGAEVSSAAVVAVAIASLLILVYIAMVFRQVPHPIRYGTCAIIALVHDVLVTVTFIGVMYFVAGWEVDALFLTAVLTVIGFSVNDTIVVFDRIRENLRRYRTETFSAVANRSLIETLQRSIATQVTAMLILAAILILGGATLQKFMATLLVGLFSGTYSSIFNATALLVAWEERKLVPDRSATISNGQTASA